jgi:hypothetical protein
MGAPAPLLDSLSRRQDFRAAGVNVFSALSANNIQRPLEGILRPSVEMLLVGTHGFTRTLACNLYICTLADTELEEKVRCGSVVTAANSRSERQSYR